MKIHHIQNLIITILISLSLLLFNEKASTVDITIIYILITILDTLKFFDN